MVGNWRSRSGLRAGEPPPPVGCAFLAAEASTYRPRGSPMHAIADTDGALAQWRARALDFEKKKG